MKLTSISKNKIIGFTLVMVVATSLGAVMYFFSSADKPAQKMPQSVIQSGGLTPTEAQTDAKAVMDLAPGTSASPPATAKPEVSGLAKNEEVVKPVAQPGRDGTATVANKKPSASTDTPDVKPSVPVASNTPEVTSPQKPVDWAAPTLGDLEKMRSENAMLAEQLKNAELKEKITKVGGVPGIPGTTNPNAAQTTGATHAAGGPRVLMIAGGENNYRANVLMPNGQTITASVGTVIDGYGVVSAITPNEVLFGSGKAKRSIPLVGNSANSDFVMGQ
ncbi:type IV pilus biogenesis protein PilP [Polynucleobacter sp. Fuers-14]|uniref:type IV pilus biogenesis protein PilP n=1 Tax=Polynucleobacter sp. Fuers-14 TaxID=1758364 RepID=UPI001C0DDC88|nr:type IV pilus biogenesis protein PilP [Polynucleobacter sp. Fuers-14]MBU3640980.1 type IV pilus biogenesis protein PilP [Polynucleobacter sp. Fuers-14]